MKPNVLWLRSKLCKETFGERKTMAYGDDNLLKVVPYEALTAAMKYTVEVSDTTVPPWNTTARQQIMILLKRSK